MRSRPAEAFLVAALIAAAVPSCEEAPAPTPPQSQPVHEHARGSRTDPRPPEERRRTPLKDLRAHINRVLARYDLQRQKPETFSAIEQHADVTYRQFLRRVDEQGFDAATASPFVVGAFIRDIEGGDRHDELRVVVISPHAYPVEAIFSEKAGDTFRDLARVSLTKSRPLLGGPPWGQPLNMPLFATPSGFPTENGNWMPAEKTLALWPVLEWPEPVRPDRQRLYVKVRDENGRESDPAPLFIQADRNTRPT